MLTLNIDWFQPFDSVTHSSGAIYLTINNLPCDETFKPEDIIFVDLMSGPKEPKTNEMNGYLEPATRKTSGLTKPNSTCACYSNAESRLHAKEWKDTSTHSERHQLEFASIEKIAETMVLPRDYTMLTNKIGKGFSYMKANEWKLWVLVYSPVLLCDILSPIQFKNWMYFVDNFKTNGKDGFEATYMKNFVQNAYKSDYVNAVLKSSSQIPFIHTLSKLVTTSIPAATVTTLSSRPFRLQAFVQGYTDPYNPPKGNESLPSSTFPLKYKKPSDTPYNCLALDNHIIKLKSIDILSQHYRGKNNSTISCRSLVQSKIVDIHDHQHVFAFIKWFHIFSDRSHEDGSVEFCLPTFSPDGYHSIISQNASNFIGKEAVC
ncbi:hypothetical protein PHYBLDRAFT_153537 [Phycomyces blakesleeanus NRRL 1555(-)]|uniref:Uncharacterized protein n=1 Tax=Phycomyces blakesleeanus (strain ATCC 8743b / DSM 1359 / FGSC 10004 / NBRC 33097 / NRRL 1555) TaxID=763407 RepID=A0A162N2V5_PHYB8|nr:hypothetical protein PHYBLDRAFT_153537 [Phycomyces blakesleeanus NRRL 1555(-)]OAD65294.1 hypothetical protein PHYBLDRAFT_153537 [Phycomyces blakesleeanus NRRL 1555(-)]|eukprot:XP_018283334.1 hypothetical protein PHYBLDRAFT_153537 [Phycomyces blakesleeanus NRRL 1555(-)]